MKIVFNGETLLLKKNEYANNGRTCLSLTDEDGIPYMTASVNVPDFPLRDDEIFIKNYSENEGILEALVEAGVVRDTGIGMQTGHVLLNICELL